MVMRAGLARSRRVSIQTYLIGLDCTPAARCSLFSHHRNADILSRHTALSACDLWEAYTAPLRSTSLAPMLQTVQKRTRAFRSSGPLATFGLGSIGLGKAVDSNGRGGSDAVAPADDTGQRGNRSAGLDVYLDRRQCNVRTLRISRRQMCDTVAAAGEREK